MIEGIVAPKVSVSWRIHCLFDRDGDGDGDSEEEEEEQEEQEGGGGKMQVL